MLPTLTQQLLRVSEPARSSSPEALRFAGRTFFDWLCCVRAGEAAGRAWPGDGAARLAVAAHALDRDDLHHASLTHPGGVVWSAISAAAAGHDVGLDSALAGGAYGYEVMTRLALGLGHEHRRYWHVTATAGTVGAAVGASAALGGTAEDLESAAGHAISVAGGSIRAILERSGTRFFHRAHAASTGVAAARAAAAGVAASRFGLEGDDGLLAAAGGGGAPEALLQTGGIKRRREHRRPPAWGERVRARRDRGGRRTSARSRRTPIAAIVATLSRATVHLASNQSPASDEEAWWSVEHAVAVCVATGDPAALTGGLSRDEGIRELAARVSLAAEDVGWGARVELTSATGRDDRDRHVRRAARPSRPPGQRRAAPRQVAAARGNRRVGAAGGDSLDGRER